MPQMMPLNWFTLYMFFSLIFLMFNSMNYYIHLPKSSLTDSLKIITKSMIWKW